MRILIAEDDQVLADGLLRTLRASGAAVDHVATGTEADAALMTTDEFDLLILDLGLPKMHGLDVLKRLRARGSAVPVLILTAADGVEERVKGLDYGADDYMAKPFSLQELEARARAHATVEGLTLKRSFEVRFTHQSVRLRVPIPAGPIDKALIAEAEALLQAIPARDHAAEQRQHLEGVGVVRADQRGMRGPREFQHQQLPAHLERAAHRGERARLVGDVAEAKADRDAVERAVPERQALGVGLRFSPPLAKAGA